MWSRTSGMTVSVYYTLGCHVVQACFLSGLPPTTSPSADLTISSSSSSPCDRSEETRVAAITVIPTPSHSLVQFSSCFTLQAKENSRSVGNVIVTLSTVATSSLVTELHEMASYNKCNFHSTPTLADNTEYESLSGLWSHVA